MSHELLLRDVEVRGERLDVRVTGPTVAEVGRSLQPGADAEIINAHGGALLPGLHDHHLHLLATAAARASVAVGPPAVTDRGSFAETLRAADLAAPAGRWLRAVGYHEAVAGDLDRGALDDIVPHRPLRLQHRTGARWTLNSAAIEALSLERRAGPGAERDAMGRLTGRLHRADEWLRQLLPTQDTPDLASLGSELARHGVTGVTDATPTRSPSALALLAGAVADGALPQRVMAMSGPELAGVEFPASLERGPVKIIIDDADYPGLDDLVGHIRTAHSHGRPVAIHCVTRASLVLALTAWDITGPHPGDRVEHGSVIPPECLGPLAAHGLTVVTQPGFVAERGDDYLTDVDLDDQPHLYPCRRLLEAGIPVAGSTDAPYTATDPWTAMRAAVERKTSSGAVVAASEAIDRARALRLFLGAAEDPGGPSRTVRPGAPADLCLLSVPLSVALRDLSSEHVHRTICSGHPIS